MRTDTIPVIDIAELGGQPTLAALDAACRDWGFFQVVHHGIDAAIIAALQRAMRDFFAQPPAAKRAISRSADNPWGFYDRELTRNTRDHKEIYDYGPAGDGAIAPQWPSAPVELKPAVLAFYSACETLAHRLLAAISTNLGMPADYLARSFRPAHTSFLRLNYYPIEPDASGLGINRHTDAGALTLLLQDDQAGLEVYRRGGWHLVEPRADALVINIGDIVQVWSNDRYRAALHRVRASAAAPRYSAPFFFNPAYATDYAPLPTTADAAHPPQYRPINWGEFRLLRAAGDYADCGEEVQISHYRYEEANRHGIH